MGNWAKEGVICYLFKHNSKLKTATKTQSINC